MQPMQRDPVNTDWKQWVEDCIRLTKPSSVHWCDGSRSEYRSLISRMVHDGTLLRLNHAVYPDSYLHRSDPSDVARTEESTFISSETKEQAGPTNNWMSSKEAKDRLTPLFDGCMKGRTMYVIPYLLGPVGSPMSRAGFEITDSPYVAASMHLMTRIGNPALDRFSEMQEFVPGLHSVGDLSPEKRAIVHFPEERLVWSYGSMYGGNAMLGKKSFGLRLASVIGREQGWYAEHMLVMGVQEPGGAVTYIAAAFPSASGKTNLAMMVPALEQQGYRVWTVSDDIAWLYVDREGQLRAVNPEAGFFGVAAGTSVASNPVAMKTMNHNCIFTNVAVSGDGLPWWEGIGTEPPVDLLDWRGRLWNGSGTAAHPNARFTVAARQCPSISPEWESPAGVPISAIVFGSKRSALVPLVYEALSWQHGVFIGAGLGTETTAAATGKVGVVRRDPMAMLPFCGYNMGDYFQHWLELGPKLRTPPKIFRVNWFLKDADGKFLWPGYGENIRVIKWILDRVRGNGEVVETPLGGMPAKSAMPMDGLDLDPAALEQLLRVDTAGWIEATDRMGEFFRGFGDKFPSPLWEEHKAFRKRLGT